MGPTPILEMARAYGLRPRLRLLLAKHLCTPRSIHKLNCCLSASPIITTQLIMAGHSKNFNTSRVEEKENSTQQGRSTEASQRVSEPGRPKYNTRAAKKLEEGICERKQHCIREEDETKKHRDDILKSKHSSDVEVKIYKQTFSSFKRKMVEAYGETFYYNGGSWHGEESRRYQHYHIRKSMRFLNENMNSDDE